MAKKTRARFKDIPDIRKQAKPYKELIVPVQGLVKKVLGISVSKKFTLGLVSGTYGKQKTGYIVGLELDLNPDTVACEVKKLVFKGYSPIRAGDLVRAYVFKGKEVNALGGEPLGLPHSGPILNEPRERTFLIERPWNEAEEALYLEILDIRNGKVLRADYGIHHHP
jgi:hypothetical protein